MADASYDAVIIGSGPNALVTACYLAYNGLSVAIFEKGDTVGGGAYSDESALPGFICDPAALLIRLWNEPVYSDFKLAEKGLDLAFFEASRGAAFVDGTCIMNYPAYVVLDKTTGSARYSEENAEKTFKSIAGVSERDAETARILFEKIRTKWHPAINEVTYNPPKPWGEKNAIEMLMDDPDSGFEPVYSVMTIEQMARELWDSPEMQSFFMRRVQTRSGLWPDDVPGTVRMAELAGACLPGVMDSMPVGGMKALPRAYQRAIGEMGGEFFVGHEVAKVLIENGVAKGIRLADGTEIEAKRMVISNADAEQTILRFLEPDYISPKIVRRVRNILRDRGPILWVYVALDEAPRYRAEDLEPNCALLSGKYLIPKNPDYLGTTYKAEAWTYGVPKDLSMVITEASLLDKTRAPEGKYLGVAELYIGLHRTMPEEEWLGAREKIGEEVLRQWQQYAPNVTKDRLVGYYVYTPGDYAKKDISMGRGHWAMGDLIASQSDRFRPIPELSNYRMPVRNMYLASAAASGGATARGLSGYICYKVIAQDFGLRKVWEEKGRAY